MLTAAAGPAIAPAPPSETAASTTTRLHISPLSPSLVPAVLPPTLLPLASGISFHTLEAFPERRYGFVDLPAAAAEKLRRKLHGAVLRGHKMRVTKARPDHIPTPPVAIATATAEDEQRPGGGKRRKKRRAGEEGEGEHMGKSAPAKRRKRTDGVYEGVELGDRKVKRAWTTVENGADRKQRRQDKRTAAAAVDDNKHGGGGQKKAQIKSKYTNQPELLFRLRLPPNAPNLSQDGAGSKEHRKKKTEKGRREVVVHEFAKTNKFPSFLAAGATSSSTDAGPAVAFVDGVGWVSEDGSVVQAVSTRPRAKKPEPAQEAKDNDSDDENSSDTSSSGSDSSSDSGSDSGSGSGSDSGSDSMSGESEAESPKKKHLIKPEVTPRCTPIEIRPPTPISAAADATRPLSSASARGLSIKIPSPAAGPATVHPLEALYKKKPAETGSGSVQPFSFFDVAAEEGEDGGEEGDLAAPLTPFTRRDLERRRERSAAPTPDTAHPSRTRELSLRTVSGPGEGEGEGRDDDESLDDEKEMAGGKEGEERDGETTSEFQAFFWETRAELNRSWMKRRKAVAKERRQRENRARGR